VLDASGKNKPSEEVPKIVRESEKLKPYPIVPEVPAGKPCPLQGVLAFLDPLLSAEPCYWPCVSLTELSLLQGGWAGNILCHFVPRLAIVLHKKKGARRKEPCPIP
jgi:hypothetical protein